MGYALVNMAGEPLRLIPEAAAVPTRSPKRSAFSEFMTGIEVKRTRPRRTIREKWNDMGTSERVVTVALAGTSVGLALIGLFGCNTGVGVDGSTPTDGGAGTGVDGGGPGPIPNDFGRLVAECINTETANLPPPPTDPLGNPIAQPYPDPVIFDACKDAVMNGTYPPPSPQS